MKTEAEKILEALGALGDKVKGLESESANAKAAQEAKAAREAYKSLATESAKEVVKELENKLEESQLAFTTYVSENKDLLAALSTEIKKEADDRAEAKSQYEELETRVSDIAQAVKSGNNKFHTSVISDTEISKAQAKEARDLVMLAWCKSAATNEVIGTFETEYGKAFQAKAVNDSSSIEVSSEAYETVFSTSLQRAIEERLVVKKFFQELPMQSKLLTVPLNAEYQYATWVDAANYGTTASTGGEVTVALTETTFRTFKLAAKAYITDETSEDAILALIPIITEHLVQAHAKAIELALISGTGATNHQPTGLYAHATTLGTIVDASEKITGSVVLAMRKKLGKFGMKLNNLALVVGQDAYWDLLDDDDYKDASKLGDSTSQLRTGVVGKIHGMDVVISDEIATVAAASSGVAALLVYTPNYRIPRQRAFITQTDYDVERQRRIIVNTQRLGFQPVFASHKTVSAVTLTKS